MARHLSGPSILVSVLVLSIATPAQCDPQWQPGDPAAWLSGRAEAMTLWDPDGSGPSPVLLVVGGLVSGGSQLGGGLAAWDGTLWQPLGGPPGFAATALGVFNGQLVAALTSSTGQTIATFDGTTWQNLCSVAGVNGIVHAFAVYNGELVVAGSFNAIDGQPLLRIARWTGSAWTGLGSGIIGPLGVNVEALAVFGGLLYAGGFFVQAGGISASCLAAWDGSVWAAAGDPNDRVRTLAVRGTFDLATTYLFAGGDFSSIGGVSAQYVARRSAASSAWVALGSGPPGSYCESLFVRLAGPSSFELTALSYNGGLTPAAVHRWTGSSWASLGSIADPWGAIPAALSLHGGRYVVALRGAEAAVRSFDGASWAPLAGPGIDGQVHAVLDLGSEVVIGGEFRAIAGQIMNGIARRGPGGWQPLGLGLNGTVRALGKAPNGDVIAAGDFTMAGGQTANRVARWNGSSWSPVGAGTDGPVQALAVLPNGDVVVTGPFSLAGGNPIARIARWDGNAWFALGGGVVGEIHALAAMSDGALFAGGSFTQAGTSGASRIARFSAGVWSTLGSGVDGDVYALSTTRDGWLLVGGIFTLAGGSNAACLAAWDGTTWYGLRPRTPPQGIRAVVQLPDGDFAVGGRINVGTVASPEWVAAARLHLGNWSDLGIHGWDDPEVNTLVWRPGGELLVGGHFAGAGDQVAGHFARLVAPCPAAVTAVGSGCSGSAGVLAFDADSDPWLGGIWRATAAGFAPGAVALHAIGLPYPPIPLDAVFAVAGPGCALLVNPLATFLLAPTNGALTVQHDVPVLPALVGGIVREQVFQFEFGAGGAWTGLSSSNALELRVGVF